MISPRRCAALLFLLTLGACSRSSRYLQSRCAAVNSLGLHDCTRYVPALQELISRPETFDGLPVQLLGYATLEPEGTALFISRESYEHGFTRDGVWLVIPDSLRAAITATVPGYVIVEGVFEADSSGHNGLFSGGIDRIRRLDTWRFSRGQATGTRE
ncbi:MAG: hypothetical protein ABI587_09855 [Gemmatimonadales bacterium]